MQGCFFPPTAHIEVCSREQFDVIFFWGYLPGRWIASKQDVNGYFMSLFCS